jgi:hypothetical protein
VAVLISSCDAYADAWYPCLTLLHRYWPDCPWPLRLVTNHRRPVWSAGEVIAVGDDHGWADNLRVALDQLDVESLIYLQEDYWLQSPVDTQRLRRVLEFARQTGAAYVRLGGGPDPDAPFANELGLGQLSHSAPYRCSLQAAVWNVAALRSLLRAAENGWQMELQGTERARTLAAPFFATYARAPLIDYYEFTAIMKGAWVPGALRLCRREGILVDTSQRPIHGEWPFLVKRFRELPGVRQCRAWWKQRRRAA